MDEKLTTLYSRVQDMAVDQATFNSMIQSTQDNMADPMKKEIIQMRVENESIHKELKRALNTNRQIISKVQNIKSDGFNTSQNSSKRGREIILNNGNKSRIHQKRFSTQILSFEREVNDNSTLRDYSGMRSSKQKINQSTIRTNSIQFHRNAKVKLTKKRFEELMNNKSARSRTKHKHHNSLIIP
mmetsp:Transcript_28083/g.24810  ORF Transcript_28083/g.24810 Transcript_28083/m.24810 type:complete len:185 (+) Transcript_28083:116-670(+)